MLKQSFAMRWQAFPLLAAALGLAGPVVADEPPADEKPLLRPVCPEPTQPLQRRRPGDWPMLRYEAPECNPEALPAPYPEMVNELSPVPSRWRIVEALGYPDNRWDPYSGNNPLKGDRPVFGEDWFFNVTATSNTLFEPRRVPVVRNPGHGVAGSPTTSGDQFFFRQDFTFDTVLYQGDTIFRPPDWAFRFTPVVTLRTTNGEGKSFSDHDFAVQSLYVEKHLWDVSANYDFDSIRVGIQPFNADFRGFLFLDQPLGIRLFGTRYSNVFQYNLAWFRNWEKHETTNLNKVEDRLRDHDIFLANLYWQDTFNLGFDSQFLVAYSRSKERGVRINADESGISPATFTSGVSHDFDVVYLGYNGDGHFGRLNLTGSMYGALGQESQGAFTGEHTDVRAFFAAAEASMDFDWIRVRLSGFHASGDDDPFDDDAEGFDAIRSNPTFAGADTSFYIRQRLILPGGAINLSRRNSLFNGFRPGDDSGQSSFTNPGMNMLGLGMDFDVLPELRISFNANQLWFDETDALEALLAKKSVAHNIGQDLSVSAIYRPFNNQNMVLRASGAALIPGEGYRDIYDSDTDYSIQGSVLLTY